MKILSRFVALLFASVVSLNAFSQTPSWGFKIGAGADDAGQAVKVAPNGNIVVAGKFSGTVDLDPSGGTFNITSNGGTDIFVACYSPSGAFQWGFNIGGSNPDEATELAIDTSNNVIIGGAFMGSGIDFNPGAGTAVLPFVGGVGAAGGDGFVAKYSSTGVYQWAYNLGASTRFDFVTGVAADKQNNVYICGYFTGTMAPAASVSWNSSTTGKGFVIKYTPAGGYVWGIVFGWPGYAADDSYPLSLQVSNGRVYTCGVLEGTSNMDPAGSSAGALSPAGRYDGYYAIYDTAGSFIFTSAISGPGTSEYAANVALDASDNMYITGVSQSNAFTFFPASAGSSTVTGPGGGGNSDIFIAKYAPTGAYRWGRLMGAAGDDVGVGSDVDGASVYLTGHFARTVDFDPSASVFNLTSNGNTDIYISRFDTAGNYMCSFNVGSAGDDHGWGTHHDAAGNLIATGNFTGTGVDFDPGTSTTFPLSSAGSIDGYLVKFNWTDIPPTGTATGDTICAGQPATASINVTTGGAGPYSVTVTDGTSSYTFTGVTTGVPFSITPVPTVTTTYTVTSVTSATSGSSCLVPGTGSFGTFTIVVRGIPANIATLAVDCSTIRFTGTTGNNTYNWAFGDGSTATTNPAIHSYASAGTYTVTLHVSDTSGCTANDTVTVTTTTPLVVDLGPDTSICTGMPYLIQSTNAYPTGTTYLWNTGAVTPGIVATTSGFYWLKVTNNGCESSDSLLLYIVYDSLKLMNEDTVICKGKQVQAVAYINPAATVQWLPTAGIGVSSVANALFTPDTTAMYTITVRMVGCPPLIDSFRITVQPNPDVYLGGNRFVCEFDTLHLHAQVKPGWFSGYTYSWSPTTFLFDTTTATVTYTAGATTKYVVTVTTSAGCVGKDSAVIIVNPGNFGSIRPDTVVCPHDSVLVTAAGGASYHWSPTMYLNDSTAAAPWCTPITTTAYSVIATSAAGCKDTMQFVVSVWPGALISLEDSARIYPGESYHIQPGTNCISFVWTPPVGLDNGFISNPVAQPEADTRYMVTGTTVNGCKATDSIDVLVSKESLIEVPNAFTPGTGNNNTLYVINRGQAQINYFRVFNRWGNLVFETKDINTGWDGTYKGEPQPFGVYVYDVQAVTITGRLFKKHGNVTLLR